MENEFEIGPSTGTRGGIGHFGRPLLENMPDGDTLLIAIQFVFGMKFMDSVPISVHDEERFIIGTEYRGRGGKDSLSGVKVAVILPSAHDIGERTDVLTDTTEWPNVFLGIFTGRFKANKLSRRCDSAPRFSSLI
jgi:hypothetical protein